MDRCNVSIRTVKRPSTWFRYVNSVPLNKSHTCWLIILYIQKGKCYHNSWVTMLHNYMYCMKVMRGGRAKWKVENETFNTLKNLGYSLEHNYGHGKENFQLCLPDVSGLPTIR